MSAPRRVALVTHHRVEDTYEVVEQLVKAITEAGGEVLVRQDEADKHDVDGCSVVDDLAAAGVDVAVALGGDGTMLGALRDFAGTGAPVFTFNFGAVGFLATMERDEVDEGIRRLVEGDFETVELPTLVVEPPAAGRRIAVNDIAFLRRSGSRVAQIAYAVRGDEVASARCDGLVVSTPVGSTGYNLANGGPVVAWGVEGYVVGYIAPHTLKARTLVAAKSDVLLVTNLSREEPVDVETDGKRVCSLDPGQSLEVRFDDHPALLAKVSGTGFYDQLIEKFGLLAS